MDERPDLVVLDLMLPGMSGLDVCRELRRKHFDAPIIMLTARRPRRSTASSVWRSARTTTSPSRSASANCSRAFGCACGGAFRRRQRCRPAVRRRRGGLRQARDDARRPARRSDEQGVRACCGCSREHRGEIVTRERLLEEVWGYEHYPTTRTVDNHMLRLRQKLERNPSDPRHILSVYGEGYKFVA